MIAPTAVITPWYRRVHPRGGSGADQSGATSQTRILDHESAPLVQLAARARDVAGSPDPIAVLEAAHAIIRTEVRPVYALEETTPASRTLERGFGSCSQRLAILESVARSLGIPTRVRALLIDRSFWAPRFPRAEAILPDRMMLAWPEFDVAGTWRSASELFGPIGCRGGASFSNDGAETLFEAAGRCAVDWDGHTSGEFDLSRFVRADFGYFADRDELFARLGQTLCAPTRLVADRVLRHIAA